MLMAAHLHAEWESTFPPAGRQDLFATPRAFPSTKTLTRDVKLKTNTQVRTNLSPSTCGLWSHFASLGFQDPLGAKQTQQQKNEQQKNEQQKGLPTSSLGT